MLRAYEASTLAALGKIDAVKEVIEKSMLAVSTRGNPGYVMLEAVWALRTRGHWKAYFDIANRP